MDGVCTANCSEPSVGSIPSMVSTLITSLLAAQCALEPLDLFPKNFRPEQPSEGFDFVVVGSGAGGGVIARRLTEVSDFRVLVVEAGGLPPVETMFMPLFSEIALTQFTYNSTSYSNKTCKATGGYCGVGRGKMLGGSTSLNSLYYTRGTKNDFDEWESVYGLDNWSYADCLPYFKKSENNSNKAYLYDGEAEYHGFDGPLGVGYITDIDEGYQLVIDANVEIGIPLNIDINGPNATGVTNFQFMIKEKRRQSSILAYINPVKDRENLFVMQNAFATKVIIEDGVARGVEIDCDGESFTAFATKEVIVSAGTVGSPQLLLNSGIGPRSSLEEKNIEVVADLPVGIGFQDHVGALVYFKGDNLAEPISEDDATYQMLIHNRGPLVDGIRVASFLNTDEQKPNPNYEVIFSLYPKGTLTLKSQAGVLGTDGDEAVVEANAEHDVFGLFILLLAPESRGEMYINSTSPYEQPAIYPNYFTKGNDLEVLTEGVMRQMQLLETEAFQSKSIELIRIPFAECDELEFGSKEYWMCYVLASGSSAQHHCCSNRMGVDASDSVLDSQLRVHGMPNLRVIDSSSWPGIIAGHMTATIMMVAERAADFIKQTYGKS